MFGGGSLYSPLAPFIGTVAPLFSNFLFLHLERVSKLTKSNEESATSHDLSDVESTRNTGVTSNATI